MQLDKVKLQLNQIAKIGQELQANNKNSLGQIDASYKQTAELEINVIKKK